MLTFACPRNPDLQFIQLHPPLGDVVVGSLLHRFDRDIFRTVGGHQDAHGGAIGGLGPIDEFHAVQTGHAQIRQQHLKVLLLQQSDRRLRVLRHVDVITILQCCAQPVPCGLLVINYQQLRLIHEFCFENRSDV